MIDNKKNLEYYCKLYGHTSHNFKKMVCDQRKDCRDCEEGYRKLLNTPAYGKPSIKMIQEGNRWELIKKEHPSDYRPRKGDEQFWI